MQRALSRVRPGMVLPCLAAVLILGCGGTNPVSAPTITSFTPASGLAGATVTVTGTNFSTSITTVTLGGVTVPASTGSVLSTTQISFPVPSAALTGPIAITNAAGTGQSATDFIVAPAITTLSPVTGSTSEGTPVTITGTGLMGITAITFGTTAATPTTHTATEIIVPVPAGATVGAATITFTVNPSYDFASLLSSFTVTK